MLGKTGLSLATSPYPFGYELSRFFLFQFSTINFFFFAPHRVTHQGDSGNTRTDDCCAKICPHCCFSSIPKEREMTRKREVCEEDRVPQLV